MHVKKFKWHLLVVLITMKFCVAADFFKRRCGDHDSEDSTSDVAESYKLCKEYNRKLIELDSTLRQSILTIDSSYSESIDQDVRKKWKKSLVHDQKYWKEYVSSDCNIIEYEWFGGKGAGRATTDCYIQRISERIEDLNERYVIKALNR